MQFDFAAENLMSKARTYISSCALGINSVVTVVAGLDCSDCEFDTEVVETLVRAL